MSQEKQQLQMKAVILNEAPLKVTAKANGGISHLHRANIIDGPFEGKEVLCNRTVLNAKQEEKKDCVKDQTVNLFMSVIPAELSTTGKAKPMFEVQLESSNVAEDADLLAIFAESQTASQHK